jgi:LacI family transcriptional regulator
MTDLRARRPTIDDVARAAGVSRSTTSRALRGDGYVAAAVRDRVVHAADTLGYVPNAVASSLRTRASRSIGVLVSDLRDPFYSELAAGVALQAGIDGYTMVLLDSRGSAAEELAAARALVGMQVAGVVVTPLTGDVTTYLQEQGTPVVEADRTFGSDVDTVLVDNEGATQQAIGLLVSLGHRRIAMFADETEWTTGAGRFRGYAASLRAAGIPWDDALVARAGSDVAVARQNAIALLTAADRPTAVFCANSVLAEGLWRAVGDLGLRVPNDLSIVAFDDAPWMSLVVPGVTAIAQQTEAMGRAAMSRLLARVESPGSAGEHLVLGAALLARGSTVPPAGA